MRISVVTATRNAAATLEECLDSVVHQSWVDKEHVVIDGMSSDATREILAGRSAQGTMVVREPDDGIYDALNKGIRRATGEVVGFLHADDVFADEEVLSRVGRAFQDPAVQGVYGDLLYVRRGDTSKVVRRWTPGVFKPRKLEWGWMPPHPTLYVRRGWYEVVGGFDTTYRIAADYLSILRLFTHEEFTATYIPEVFVRMRLGGASNRSVRNVLLKSREDLRAMRATGVGALGGWGALAWKNLSKLPQFIGHGPETQSR